jgi:hypothetical protein
LKAVAFAGCREQPEATLMDAKFRLWAIWAVALGICGVLIAAAFFH